MKLTREERAAEAERHYQQLRASLDVLELAMRAKGLNHVLSVWSLLQAARAEAEDLRKIMDWKSVDADG
jgi:cell division septum initiation protein DivIVA